MLDQEFSTLCVMVATLRAGRSGPADQAWGKALEEAVSGYAMILKNRANIAKITALQTEAAPSVEEPSH